jgi:glycosyltransferase involved in cell wall biosynthesis
MNPKVSVIIPNCNYSQYVGEAVESVLSQTYANIVVDDGSKDNSLEILRTFGDKMLAFQPPEITVLQIQTESLLHF